MSGAAPVRGADPVYPGLSYVLPLKAADPADPELTSYLVWLSSLMEVVVADGSEAAVFAANHELWGGTVRHVAVHSSSLNGKVAGVCDGVLAARGSGVIIADDDVRYDGDAVRAVVDLLTRYDAVVPQNHFDPERWHTHWDTGRTLINRAMRGDFAGTIALRRDAFMTTRGYCGAVLFENLELMRTLEAHGFRVRHARDLFVARRPPSLAQFCDQRVRQAYDSLAQPGRMAAELALLPMLAAAVARSRAWAPAAALTAAALAEVGRRRDGGRRVFSPLSALCAPLWVAERAVCSWLAVGSYLAGGARYSGRRLRTAAHRPGQLSGVSCPDIRCSCRLALRSGPVAAPAQRVAA